MKLTIEIAEYDAAKVPANPIGMGVRMNGLDPSRPMPEVDGSVVAIEPPIPGQQTGEQEHHL